MDATDQAILNALKQNSRATASEIGKQVKLSVPAVAERIRKLEQSGVLEQYTVKLNREKTGMKLLAFILVNVGPTERVEPFRAAVTKYGAVLECHHIAGEYDYLLKVLVEDAAALDRFLSEHLKRIGGVARTNTIIALATLKEELNT
jgi:Lrp/AsnC family leucine-responsive transcriptional regulator